MTEDFKLDDTDRRHLRETARTPGYRVLVAGFQAYLKDLEDRARAVSEVDPLKNAEEIARQWAYFGIARDIVRQIHQRIQAEITMEAVREHQKGDSPAEEIARRLHETLGELDPFVSIKEKTT